MPKKLVKIEVLVKQLYVFEEGEINGWSPEQVVKDWFAGTPMYQSHASRDAHKVGYSDNVQSVTIDGKKVTV